MKTPHEVGGTCCLKARCGLLNYQVWPSKDQLKLCVSTSEPNIQLFPHKKQSQNVGKKLIKYFFK